MHFLLFDNVSCNQLLHDLVGASIDGLHPGVGVGLGNVGLPHETPASVQLQAVSSHLVVNPVLIVVQYFDYEDVDIKVCSTSVP